MNLVNKETFWLYWYIGIRNESYK